MNFWTPLACAVVICGTTVAAHAKITRTVEKTFAVQPGGRLNAETQGGNITVKTADANEVRVVVTQVIDANSEEAAVTWCLSALMVSSMAKHQVVMSP